MDEAQIKRLARAYYAGVSMPDLESRFQRSYTNLLKILTRNGYDTTGKVRKAEDADCSPEHVYGDGPRRIKTSHVL